ncbi:uncharacterized protein LOC126662250 [Mercurialis annua]|uniref:uncharacterized protein LOC126662250 n=1 Tax=Mercurialis annua TaxID=3986 RepID=UPI00215E6961|nr:uncharacterized protein LOC126662250 [Mercurialis annua]
MLASMNNELQKQHEKYPGAREILFHLQELYGESSRSARYEISKQLFRAKLSEGKDVGEHVNMMIRCIERLEGLDFIMDFNLQTDMILQSLPDSYGNFITNYYMNRIECTLAELSSMLITAQKNNVKGKEVSLVVASSSKTKKKKTKKNVLKAQKAIAKRKRTSENKGKCFFCEGEGHWKRNCPKYKEFKGKNKKNENPGEGSSK